MDATERHHRAGREAAQWWALLQAGDAPRAERERFIEWLCESKVHVVEFLRIVQVQGTLEQFKEWHSIDVEGASESTSDDAIVVPITQAAVTQARVQRNGEMASRGRWRRAAMAIAAGVAALVVGGILVVSRLQGQLIATDRGERREVVLEDGSIVQVDPQTRLRVQFEADTRRLQLIEGRALFRVAKDPQRPFLVESGDATVRAVGTAFGVERRADHALVVTVVEGKVAVVTQSQRELQQQILESATADSTLSAPAAIFLTANQQVTVQPALAAVPVQAVDSSQELAWAEGRLIFKDEAVAQVVAEFNRYNRVQLRVTDATLSARRVSGVFDAAYPEEFIAFLEAALPVNIERAAGGTITISPSK